MFLFFYIYFVVHVNLFLFLYWWIFVVFFSKWVAVTCLIITENDLLIAVYFISLKNELDLRNAAETRLNSKLKMYLAIHSFWFYSPHPHSIICTFSVQYVYIEMTPHFTWVISSLTCYVQSRIGSKLFTRRMKSS